VRGLTFAAELSVHFPASPAARPASRGGAGRRAVGAGNEASGLGEGEPRAGDVPGGQFALDGGQAAGGEGRQQLPACGAVGLWQFGLDQVGLVDAAVDQVNRWVSWTACLTASPVSARAVMLPL
jgi:hypothetical protein